MSARRDDEQCRPCQNPNFGARKANPSFPLTRPCQNCPLSLWERVGVREPRGKQAGVNGKNGSGRVIGGPHPAFGHPLPEGEGLDLGRVAPAFGHLRNRLWQFPGERPIRHPAKAGIQGSWRGPHAPFPHSTPPGFPLTRPCQNCPLSLWERVGVREPRGKQAGVNGKEWERQGYWGPSPGLRPPSPRGRGVGFGTGRTGLRPPSPRGRGVGFGTGRTGLRPPSPRGRGVRFGTGRNAKRTRRFITVFVRHHTRTGSWEPMGTRGAGAGGFETRPYTRVGNRAAPMMPAALPMRAASTRQPTSLR